MALRTNETIHLRKASRPLSIIDENPGDGVKCQKSKAGSDITTQPFLSTTPTKPVTSVSSLTINLRSSDTSSMKTRETRQIEPSRIGTARPQATRRKAVAPLEHPVDYLIGSLDKNKDRITGKENKEALTTNDATDKMCNMETRCDSHRYKYNNDLLPEMEEDENEQSKTFPKYLDSGSKFISKGNNHNTYLNNFAILNNKNNNHIKAYNSDHKTTDRDLNSAAQVNDIININDNKKDIPSKRFNHRFYISDSEDSSSDADSGFLEKKTLKYVADYQNVSGENETRNFESPSVQNHRLLEESSLTQLPNFDLLKSSCEKNDIELVCKTNTFNDFNCKTGSISPVVVSNDRNMDLISEAETANMTDGKTVEDVDAEQQVWKNRVKTSHSFIKSHGNAPSPRPMRRSVSATFGNSPSDGKTTSPNLPHSPGSIRRFLSVHSYHRTEELQIAKSHTFSEVYKYYDKSSPQSSQMQYSSHKLSRPSVAIKQSSNSNTHVNIASATSVSDILASKEGPSHSRPSTTNDQQIRRISTIDQTDFRLLEKTANRLHLKTRRPSVMAWRERYMNDRTPGYARERVSPLGGAGARKELNLDGSEWTAENMTRIDASLAMLRKELVSGFLL